MSEETPVKKSIPELVAELEQLLHEELPEAARAAVYDGVAGEESSAENHRNLAGVVDKVRDLQRGIGMATFEAMRKGPVEYPDDRVRDPTGHDFAPRAAAGPRPDTTPPITPPAPRCAACSRFAGATCQTCGKAFCLPTETSQGHADPAFHPCGEI